MTTQPHPVSTSPEPLRSDDILRADSDLASKQIDSPDDGNHSDRSPSRGYRSNPAVVSPDARSKPRSRALSESSRLRWFYNLPIRRKQLLTLFCSELISVLGLVGVGSWLIIQGGRAQLANQAKAELAATDIGYNIKVNQMGFGFRGQSDNSIVIEAAKESANGRTLSPQLYDRLKAILTNEVTAQNIEYATLVDIRPVGK